MPSLEVNKDMIECYVCVGDKALAIGYVHLKGWRDEDMSKLWVCGRCFKRFFRYCSSGWVLCCDEL
jgi:hypothetical protein